MREETAPTKVRFFSLQPAMRSHNLITLLMIRNFQLFCNLNRIHRSDFSILTDSLSAINFPSLICPVCQATHSCSPHAHYFRDFICFEDNTVKIHCVRIPRVFCSSCNHTHAVLPACLIPHASYSLFFILTVLRSYFLRCTTTASLCQRFSISPSTLYAWIDLFSLHKELWLGVLEHAARSASDFLAFLLDSPEFLQSFFLRFQVSFMQCHYTAHTHRPRPSPSCFPTSST